ncbi:hypothetical protein Tsubulata_009823 [Turnera subulata]|uniref:Transcription repressor n=1 Tax=Turnera subulata TaxID=218843 RepID=A0A9Q0JJU4_9ROSI|nr:hypothetical protein Tsubulata_009823 [Turnera subulata]
MTPKGKWNSGSMMGSPCNDNGGRGRGKFYGGDGDAFWRLSFGEDGVDGKMSREVMGSVLCDSENGLQFPPSCCQSCRSNTRNEQEDSFRFSDMVSDVRKMRGILPGEVEVLPEMEMYGRQKVAEIRTPRLRVERDRKLTKRNQRVIREKKMELHGEVYQAEMGRRVGGIQREDCELTGSDDPKTSRYMPFMNSSESYFDKGEEEYAFSTPKESEVFAAEKLSSGWQKLKEMKIEEFKLKSERQRKSIYVNRELERKRPKQHGKVRAYSPRTATKVEICRIRALEDMKKSKLKMKKKSREKTIEGFTGLESFAVVKCSFDPQQDFRDSMMEMIKERRIREPEELEELLACYLTLNSDEYHDLIIKVFRQVWLDLDHASFHTELENDQCYYYD